VSEEKLNRLETLILSLTETVAQNIRATEKRFDYLNTRIKTLELDMEPEGRISEGFEYLSNDLDSFRDEVNNKLNQVNKRLDRLEHGQNQIKASLGTIMERLTGWSPDE
jgi:predicted  nucleic acid-binding Zn-ribbon protein